MRPFIGGKKEADIMSAIEAGSEPLRAYGGLWGGRKKPTWREKGKNPKT